MDDVLLAPDHGADETGTRVLDDEVDLGLDGWRLFLHGARVDEVVVRRARGHPYMLSRPTAGSPEDAPSVVRHDTPDSAKAAERDGGHTALPGVDRPR